MIAPARILGGIVAAAALLGLTAASRVAVPLHRGSGALLRVAWTARPQRIERCRTLSDAELAEVPAHMRQREECESTTATYRMEIRRDGMLLAAAGLHGGGLRRDRQIYVLRELALPSGPSTVEVRVTRDDVETEDDDDRGDDQAGDRDDARRGADSDDDAGQYRSAGDDRDDRDAERRRRRAGDEIPASLVLRETVTLAPREVLLVTYDRTARRLRTVRANP